MLSNTKLSEGASDCVDHELLTNRFHVTHYAGCAIHFNKGHFFTPTLMSSPFTFMAQDADNLAVDSSSFTGLMSALAPAFRSVDSIAGLNLNYCKCCLVHYGTEERESLRTWISENCEEFREMPRQICWNHDCPRWTPSSLDSTPKNHPACGENQSFYQKPCGATLRVQDLCPLCNRYIDPYPRQTKLLSRLRPTPFSVPQQARTTQNLITFLELAPYVALVLT